MITAVKRFGYANPAGAKAFLGELAWQAVCSLGGWQAVCESPTDQRATLRAQFRVAFEGLANREAEYRSLPEHQRPAIAPSGPFVSLPADLPKGVPSLPAPPQPSTEMIEKAAAKLAVPPRRKPAAVDPEEIERSRQRQSEILRRKMAEQAKVSATREMVPYEVLLCVAELDGTNGAPVPLGNQEVDSTSSPP